jgi:hypothetical protein
VEALAFDDEGYAWASFEYPDGTKTGAISAGRDSGSFYYMRREIDGLGWQIGAEMNSDNDIAKIRKTALANLEKMKQNPMDLQDTLPKAIQVLKDLGIRDMQFKAVEPILLGGKKYDGHALCLRFIRECGSIPAATKRSESYRRDDGEPEYSLPFDVEEIEIIISEVGTIEFFYWRNPAQVVEAVTHDAQLLPIEQIKQRIVNQLFYENTYQDEEAARTSWYFSIAIQKIELRTTYINVRNEPDSAYIVPIWFITYIPTQIDESFAPGKWEFPPVDMMINALDGGIIKMKSLEPMPAPAG